MRILVTGYSGFIGASLVQLLLDAGYRLNLAGRTVNAEHNQNRRYFAIGDIGPSTDWSRALEDCQAVVHLAAQVPASGVSDELVRKVNDLGTARLLEQASISGVKRFILMSSVFAVTDHSVDTVVDERLPPAPSNPYGRSKLAAEGHLLTFSGEGRRGIALRPPLVYGAAARGNWRLLQRLAASGIPLPFGGVCNRRTLIAVDNLTDALLKLISLPHDALRPGIYMISDSESVSLAEILCWLRHGMGLPQRLPPVPAVVLKAALKALNKEQAAKSLLGDLEVDSTLFRRTFDWAPKIDAKEAVTRSGAEFVSLARG
ncbi:NAD-dependent epimerase/dehydratase family protein [Mesorhizobium sp. BAC0120]|uniref:NAD-dependent epimerase/dehydratase family protein n=1 Tax=Mesorhizobium sp. BAC0120 TaxID=3090670 RepID=UPI00298C7AD1|nr:NAD-dependent epimerase/dehydratase family protein [Mesorhizobium sp. BAC0120]MDW6020963.1 NAD-dependent epimerase/dehydratase family protein [Mesorhizobium sp. BAC0120]